MNKTGNTIQFPKYIRTGEKRCKNNYPQENCADLFSGKLIFTLKKHTPCYVLSD